MRDSPSIEGLRCTVLASAAETDGRHDGVLDVKTPGSATPAHLAGPDTEMDMEHFMAVTTELGDVVLTPPGTTPEEVAAQECR